MGPYFILNKLLPLVRFSTERKILLNDALRGCFHNSKLIGEEDDPKSLQNYSNQVMNIFINNQLVFFQMINVRFTLLLYNLYIYYIASSLITKLLFLKFQRFNFWLYFLNMMILLRNLNNN